MELNRNPARGYRWARLEIIVRLNLDVTVTAKYMMGSVYLLLRSGSRAKRPV